MNHIHTLQREVRARKFERDTLLDGLLELTTYLNSSKFSCGNELDGYVNVKDVLARIQAAKLAAFESYDAYLS